MSQVCYLQELNRDAKSTKHKIFLLFLYYHSQCSLGAFPNYNKRLLASSCLSVRLSAWNNSASTTRIFMQRRGTARTLPSCCVALWIFCVVLCIFVFYVLFVLYVFLCCSMYFCVVLCICFVSFSVLFVCKCVLY